MSKSKPKSSRKPTKAQKALRAAMKKAVSASESEVDVFAGMEDDPIVETIQMRERILDDRERERAPKFIVVHLDDELESFLDTVADSYAPPSDAARATNIIRFIARAPTHDDFHQTLKDLAMARVILEDLLAQYLDLETGEVF